MPDYNALILELYGVRNKTLVVQHQLVHTEDHLQTQQHAMHVWNSMFTTVASLSALQQ